MPNPIIAQHPAMSTDLIACIFFAGLMKAVRKKIAHPIERKEIILS